MLGPVFQNSPIPANWWGYGMPPELSSIRYELSQVFDAAGKAPVPSTPPVSPMTQVPQYATSTAVRSISGGFKVPSFQAPNTSSSTILLPTQEKAPTMSQPGVQFMPQAGYVNYHPAMSTICQPSVNFVPMNSNNG
jgi:hypothetical protein